MSYTVLARKYRPQLFSEVIGQDHVTQTLKNALKQGRIAHGYIFSGHRGIGKTTIARILAMALNCRSAAQPVTEPCGVCDSCREIREARAVDVIEIDAATNRGIDEIRELREAARYRPARDRYKIYILDEAHQITDAAFNALLKTLEEPPGHIVFMMATTQPEDIPQTIRSRCQHFNFHAVRFEEIVCQLRSIAEQEGIAADDVALSLLAEVGDGSMRDALSILDQAIACCGASLSGETIRQLVGVVPTEIPEQILEAVQQNSSETVLRLIDKLLIEGQNPTHFARQMLRFLRNALVAKVAGGDSPLLQISTEERERAARVAALFSEEDLARFLQIMLRTHADLGYKQEQRFHLELGLLKLVHAQRLLPVEQLLSGAAPPPAVPPPASSRGPAGGAPAGSHGSAMRGGSHVSSPPVRHGGPRMVAPAVADVPHDVPPDVPPDISEDTLAKIPAVPAISAPAAAGAAEASSGPASSSSAPDSSPGAPETSGVSESELPDRVITAAEGAGLNDLASMLGRGAWKVTGGEVLVEVPDSPVLVRMALGRKEADQVMSAAASQALGRPARVKLVGGGNGEGTPVPPRPASRGGSRVRAAEEPVIRRMQEKFSAEIRSIIDYRERD